MDDDAPDPPTPTRRDLRVRLVPPLVLALVLHVVQALRDHLPSVDGLAYFAAGRNLIGGHGYVRLEAPELHFPPLTPLGFAVLEKLTGTEVRAMGVWNVAWGVALVAVVAAVARRTFADDDGTVLACWFAAGAAGLGGLLFSGSGGSEAPAATLLLAAVCLVLDGVRTPADGRTSGARLWRLAAAGGAVGLAYLSRPEALLPGAVIGVGLVLWWAHRVLVERAVPLPRGLAGAARDAAAYGLVALLVLAPYVAFLHAHTGSWSPTAKNRDVSIQAWQAVSEGRRARRDHILFAIVGDRLRLQTEARSLTELASDDPATYRQILQTNLRDVRRTFVDPRQVHDGPALLPGWRRIPVWPLLPVLPLLPALAAIWLHRRRRAAWLLLAVGATPLLACVVFFTLTRYLVPTTAVLAAFGGAGTAAWLRRLPRAAGVTLLGVTGLLLAASYQAQAGANLPGGHLRADPTTQAAAGRWIAEHTPADAWIMTRSFHVQAYAHRPVVALPAASWPRTLAFARRHGVRYLVAERAVIAGRRPKLVPVLFGPEVPAGLTLVHEVGGRGAVRIFALDPPPPRSDLPPIYVGYAGD